MQPRYAVCPTRSGRNWRRVVDLDTGAEILSDVAPSIARSHAAERNRTAGLSAGRVCQMCMGAGAYDDGFYDGFGIFRERVTRCAACDGLGVSLPVH